MAVLAFVALFVLLAFGALFLAFSGGNRGRAAAASRSPGARAAAASRCSC